MKQILSGLLDNNIDTFTKLTFRELAMAAACHLWLLML